MLLTKDIALCQLYLQLDNDKVGYNVTSTISLARIAPACIYMSCTQHASMIWLSPYPVCLHSAFVMAGTFTRCKTVAWLPPEDVLPQPLMVTVSPPKASPPKAESDNKLASPLNLIQQAVTIERWQNHSWWCLHCNQGDLLLHTPCDEFHLLGN